MGNMTEAMVNKDGTIPIDVIAFGPGSKLQAMIDDLQEHGFQVVATYRHIASGTIPVSALGEMCACDSLMMAKPVLATVNSRKTTTNLEREETRTEHE